MQPQQSLVPIVPSMCSVRGLPWWYQTAAAVLLCCTWALQLLLNQMDPGIILPRPFKGEQPALPARLLLCFLRVVSVHNIEDVCLVACYSSCQM